MTSTVVHPAATMNALPPCGQGIRHVHISLNLVLVHYTKKIPCSRWHFPPPPWVNQGQMSVFHFWRRPWQACWNRKMFLKDCRAEALPFQQIHHSKTWMVWTANSRTPSQLYRPWKYIHAHDKFSWQSDPQASLSILVRRTKLKQQSCLVFASSTHMSWRQIGHVEQRVSHLTNPIEATVWTLMDGWHQLTQGRAPTNQLRALHPCSRPGQPSSAVLMLMLVTRKLMVENFSPTHSLCIACGWDKVGPRIILTCQNSLFNIYISHC